MSSGTKPSQNPQKKPESSSKEPKGKVGEWVRHISSSGKDYYFNITNHESHWEKPREWVEFEHRHGPVSYHPGGQAQTSVTPNKTLVKSASLPAAAVANVNTKDHLPHPPSSSSSHNSHNAPQLTSTTQPEPTTPTPQRALIRPLLDIAVTLSQIPPTKPTPGFSSHQNGRVGQIEPLFKDRPPPFPSYYSRPSTSAAAGSSQGYGNSNFNGYNGNDRSSTSHHSQYASSSHRQEYGNNSLKDYGHGRSHHRTPYSRPPSRHSSSDRGREPKKPVVEEPQSDDMDISPYENEDSGTDTSTKPGERSLEVASTSGSSPNMPSSARDSRNYRDRDRDRDRERNRNQTRGRNNNLYSINPRSNGTISRDRYSRGRDRNRDRGSYGPRRGGRDRDNRDRNRDWRGDSHRDQVGVRRSRWGGRDSDRGRDRGRESDKPLSTDMDTSEDKQERPLNSSNGRASPEMEHSGAAGIAEPTPHPHTNSNSHGTSVTTTDGTPKEFVVPELPPGLATYMRADLISEVNKAMDDPYERDADKMVGKIFESQVQLSGISAELKMARSIVRLSDIQSTLKEQRILFIRSQIESLEEDSQSNLHGWTESRK